MEYTRSLQASKSRRNASVSPPWHASMVRSSMMCLLINSEIQPVRRMGWIISSILFETFEWEMKMNESGGWVGGEMDGSGEWVGGGEWMGVENGFPSLERRGGCAINRIDPFLKGRRRGGHFRLAFIVSSTYSKSL